MVNRSELRKEEGTKRRSRLTLLSTGSGSVGELCQPLVPLNGKRRKDVRIKRFRIDVLNMFENAVQAHDNTLGVASISGVVVGLVHSWSFCLNDKEREE